METVFHGAGEMDSVTGAEMHRFRKAGINLAHSGDHHGGQRQPSEGPRVTLLFELSEQSAKIPGVEDPFPEFPVKSGQGLGVSEPAAGHMVRGGHLADGLPTRVLEVQSDDVTRVEVNQ